MTGRNLSLLDELIAPDYCENDEAGEPGRNGLKQFLTMFSGAFPDAAVNIQHLIAEGDLVVATSSSTALIKVITIAQFVRANK